MRNGKSRVMYFIYSLLLGLGFLILLPRFLFDAFRHGKYVAGFRERLGKLAPLDTSGQPVIWVHCVSVGEAQAAVPLVQGLRQKFPSHAIAISTITLTGQNLARKIFKGQAARVFYFPFDWRFVARRTLKAINPAIVLLMETELWPGFLRECESQQIPTVIVNGRLSERSFRRYRRITRLMSRVLRSISLAVMQTEADAARLKHLGMDAARTHVSGNMKFDAGTVPLNDSLSAEFRRRFKLTGDTPLILAASTHAPEEEILLNALRQLSAGAAPKPRLMIAPRHPERFSEVADLLKAAGLQWTRRTAAAAATDAETEVVLLDSIGELKSAYSLASIVFVGGSIANTGGHNILEPAAVGAAVITGPHTYNFKLVVETFVDADAIIQLQSSSNAAAATELAQVLSELLSNPGRQHELGNRAQTLVSQNRGATERTLDLLGSLLPTTGIPVRHVVPLGVPNAPIT
ncbi:MAG TPA: 3-deoxy-D-manno-octulosonic acid transferase [Pyrinomonadaceae bacterium]|nr:3-deoxy-D-manno-octulosonic acid transferase [Pyrinomonadaceae bacterium]